MGKEGANGELDHFMMVHVKKVGVQ